MAIKDNECFDLLYCWDVLKLQVELLSVSNSNNLVDILSYFLLSSNVIVLISTFSSSSRYNNTQYTIHNIVYCVLLYQYIHNTDCRPVEK